MLFNDLLSLVYPPFAASQARAREAFWLVDGNDLVERAIDGQGPTGVQYPSRAAVASLSGRASGGGRLGFASYGAHEAHSNAIHVPKAFRGYEWQKTILMELGASCAPPAANT